MIRVERLMMLAYTNDASPTMLERKRRMAVEMYMTQQTVIHLIKK